MSISDTPDRRALHAHLSPSVPTETKPHPSHTRVIPRTRHRLFHPFHVMQSEDVQGNSGEVRHAILKGCLLDETAASSLHCLVHTVQEKAGDRVQRTGIKARTAAHDKPPGTLPNNDGGQEPSTLTKNSKGVRTLTLHSISYLEPGWPATNHQLRKQPRTSHPRRRCTDRGAASGKKVRRLSSARDGGGRPRGLPAHHKGLLPASLCESQEGRDAPRTSSLLCDTPRTSVARLLSSLSYVTPWMQSAHSTLIPVSVSGATPWIERVV